MPDVPNWIYGLGAITGSAGITLRSRFGLVMAGLFARLFISMEEVEKLMKATEPRPWLPRQRQPPDEARP